MLFFDKLKLSINHSPSSVNLKGRHIFPKFSTIWSCDFLIKFSLILCICLFLLLQLPHWGKEPFLTLRCITDHLDGTSSSTHREYESIVSLLFIEKLLGWRDIRSSTLKLSIGIAMKWFIDWGFDDVVCCGKLFLMSLFSKEWGRSLLWLLLLLGWRDNLGDTELWGTTILRTIVAPRTSIELMLIFREGSFRRGLHWRKSSTPSRAQYCRAANKFIGGVLIDIAC